MRSQFAEICNLFWYSTVYICLCRRPLYNAKASMSREIAQNWVWRVMDNWRHDRSSIMFSWFSFYNSVTIFDYHSNILSKRLHRNNGPASDWFLNVRKDRKCRGVVKWAVSLLTSEKQAVREYIVEQTSVPRWKTHCLKKKKVFRVDGMLH